MVSGHLSCRLPCDASGEAAPTMRLPEFRFFIFPFSERQRDRETKRQRDRETDRQTDRQTDKQASRQTDKDEAKKQLT